MFTALPQSFVCGNHRLNAQTACTSTGNLSCGRCRCAHYCSSSCQKENWKIHKLICQELKQKRETYISQQSKAPVVVLDLAHPLNPTMEDIVVAETLPNCPERIVEIICEPFLESPEVIRNIWSAAVVAYREDRNGDAAELYEKALLLASSLFGLDHSSCMELQISLGHTYMAMCKFPDAESHYLQSLSIAKRLESNDETKAQSSRALIGLASLFIKQDRFIEAEPLCMRSLALTEEVYGCESPHLAQPLLVVGELRHWQGRYAETVTILERAYCCVADVHGPVHPDVQKVTNELIEALRQSGDMDRAEEYARVNYENLIEFDADKLKIGEGTLTLAAIYRDSGRFSEAEPLQREALAIFESLLGPMHGKVAGCLDALASLYLAQDQLGTETETLYMRALAIFERLHGAKSINASMIIQNLCVLCFKRGELQRADAYLQVAISMRAQLQGDEHPDVAHMRANLAYMYVYSGRFLDAEELYLSALAVLERSSATTTTQGWSSAIALPVQSVNSSTHTINESMPDTAVMNIRLNLEKLQNAIASMGLKKPK